MVGLWLSTRWRQRLCWCFISAQDVTEDSQAAGDPDESADRDNKSISPSEPGGEQATVKMEAVEAKREVEATPLVRRASTSTPCNLPVRLLTRLGSLDGEWGNSYLIPLRFASRLHFDAFSSQLRLQCRLKGPQPRYPGTSLFPKTLIAPCWEAGCPHLLGPPTLGRYTHTCHLAASLKNCTVHWPPNIDRTGETPLNDKLVY